jgi:hypothetical protein
VAELKQSFGDTKPDPVKLESGTAIKMEGTAIKMEGTVIKMEGVKSEPDISTSIQGERSLDSINYIFIQFSQLSESGSKRFLRL